MSTTELTAPLPRGGACVECRQRKIVDKSFVSLYRAPLTCLGTRSPSNARALEQHITRLESRILELSTSPGSVNLINPYTAEPPLGGSLVPQIPPVDAMNTLVQLFLPHAGKFGFFLDVSRLVASTRADPGTSGSNPLTLLRMVISLLGIRISRNPAYLAREDGLLAGILHFLHPALSASQENRNATLYILQAEILLACYFCDNNRLLEGRVHARAAVSLAMICRLHKIGTGVAPIQAGNVIAPGSPWLPPPTDLIQHKERINAWWQTFILDKCWAVASASPSMIEDKEDLDATIDTPWPLSDDNDDNPGPELFQGRTVQRFFENVLLDTNTSIPALHAKAAALYERAHHISLYQRRNLPQYDVAAASLDTAIDCFMQYVPALQAPGSPEHGDADAVSAHTLVMVHALGHCATIQLHRGFIGQNAGSIVKCFTAASMVARLSPHINAVNIGCVNPITAVLWAAAADGLVQCLRSLQNFQRSRVGSSPSMPNEEGIVFCLNTLMSAMTAFAQLSPLFGSSAFFFYLHTVHKPP
ncbi:hypothetical protein NM688_g7610 [Phlebia brevispora]|uniref:Uncharacterized protein n=1 Tax=Phlebia brevispora TaxID=194682 RepID=A0ACC1S3F5_9APHY|nr:hypothetical protein NM688_g7610 [Phlebia brevispora]